MSLTHRNCGGDVTVDHDKTQYHDAAEQETYYPIKCDKCGLPLGLLAEVEDKCQVQ